MIYREIEHKGDSFVEKEYEGTPEEIAALMMRQPEKLKIEQGLVTIDGE